MKNNKDFLTIFKNTTRPSNWEIYLPFGDNNEILLLRPICTKCKKQWSVDRKECFHCKSKYFRVKQCPNCKTIYPENVPNCSNPNCIVDNKKKKNVKVCLTCGKVDSERNVVFVPISFCWFCGNRENKFEYKIIKLENN